MYKIAVISAALVVSACSANLDRTAGAFSEPVGFGNATMNNSMVHTGQRRYVVDLNGRFTSSVPSTVNFAFNSARLDATAIAALQQQANWIRQFPEVKFRVYGHTDKVGSNAYNKRLGLRRAQTVVSYLVRQGIGRHRLEAMVSFGETQPLVVTQGRERRNRRTVTEVSGFVGRHPTIMDGKYAEVIYREYISSAVPRGQTEKASGGSE